MTISGRAAARMLAGVGVGRSAARRVLAAGFAGGPTVDGGGRPGYDAARVRALVARPLLDGHEVAARLGGDLFVVRRPGLVLGGDDGSLREQVASDWELSWWLRFIVRTKIEGSGPLPMLATVSGFVALGAELTDIARSPDSADHGGDRSGAGSLPDWSDAYPQNWAMSTLGGPCRLVLRPPGTWFEPLRRTRVRTGPGAPWWLSSWRPFAHRERLEQ